MWLPAFTDCELTVRDHVYSTVLSKAYFLFQTVNYTHICTCVNIVP